eukprot:3706287-Prymnesium_polylepis.2
MSSRAQMKAFCAWPVTPDEAVENTSHVDNADAASDKPQMDALNLKEFQQRLATQMDGLNLKEFQERLATLKKLDELVPDVKVLEKMEDWKRDSRNCVQRIFKSCRCSL